MSIKSKKFFTIIFEFILVFNVFLGMIYLTNNNTFYNNLNNDSINSVFTEDKRNDWENLTKWRYRINITLNNPLSIDVENIPIDFYINFNQYECLNNSLTLFDNLAGSSEEVPIQIWNISYYGSTTFIESSTITFLINLSASELTKYYLYYSNDSDLTTDTIDAFPEYSYSSMIESNYNGNTVSIENSLYYIDFEEGKGVYNFTLKDWTENLHSELSLTPNPYNIYPQNSENVIVQNGEYLLFIAYEDDTNITLYDATTNQRLDQMVLSFEWEWSTKTLDQYEAWRYPQKGNNFESNRIIRVEYTNPVSMHVTSMGVNREPGSYLTSDNYYSGTDQRSDDDIYSAYGQDLLLWIPRDCWITAYEPNTEVIISDIGSDGDTDDSRTLILGTNVNWWENSYWNTSMDPLIYTSNQSHPGNYYEFDPDCDPSGDDYLNSEIFDNDIVRIQSNSSITVVAGRPTDNYQTEVYGKNQMEFYFPILYKFRITATEDNTILYWRNLTHGMTDLDESYGGYDQGDLYSYQGSYGSYQDYIANAYITYLGDYNSRHQLSDAEVAKGFSNLDKGDTIQFYNWYPDYVVDYGTPMAARREDPSQSSYHTIYDRWRCAPDFYKNNWANVTADKPIKVWVGTMQDGTSSGESSQKSGNLHYFSSSDYDQYMLLGILENDTTLSLESSEGLTDQHTTIIETSDLDGDGIDEIIVGSNIIALYNSTGNKLWDYPIWATYLGGMERYGWDYWRWMSQIYTEDLNGDLYKDIIITAADSTFTILVLDGKTGKKIWYKADSSYSALDLKIGDITGDGISDIVYLEGPGYGYGCNALDGTNGEYLWRHYMGYIGWGFEVELMDINNDSLYDMMVFGLTNEWIYTYNLSKLINTSYWTQSGDLPGYNTPGWRRVILDDNRPQYDEDGGWYDRTTMNVILQSLGDTGIDGYDLRALKVGDFDTSIPGPEIVIGTGREQYGTGNYTFVAVVNYTLSNTYQNGRIGDEYQPILDGDAIWITSINPYRPDITTNDYHWVKKIATGDLNGDNCEDIIVGLGEYESSWNSHQAYEDNTTLYAYSGTTGQLIWESNGITDDIWAIKVIDINSDGQNEVLTAIRGERNGYKPWYAYLGYSGNMTLVNGSNGSIIWYKNIADGSDYRWIRSINAGNISGSAYLDLLAGTYSNNESFYLYLYNGSDWNRANWASQILPSKSFEDVVYLSKGEIIRIKIEDDYRGIIINSSKPIISLGCGSGISSSESITWIPLRKGISIDSITEINKGPLFIQYNVDWTSFMGLHTSDIMTFYANTSLWRLQRTQYWESSNSNPYTIINSLYNYSIAHTYDVNSLDLLTNINEGSYSGNHDLLTGLANVDYSMTVDSIQTNNNLSFGLFLTEFDSEEFVSLDDVFLNSQYKLSSELIEFIAITDGLSTPGGSAFTVSCNIWEYAGINKTDIYLKNIDNILDTNFIQSTSSDEIWHAISIRALDSSNTPIEGANITIYNKSLGPIPSAKIATEIVGADGYTKTFTKILEGNYTIVCSISSENYLEYAGPQINTTVDFEVNSTNKNLQIQLNVISLNIRALYKSNLMSLESIPSEDLFINAKICIYNTTTGASIVNQTTDYSGQATFYLVPVDPGNWNYSIKVRAYDGPFDIDIVERKNQGFLNYTSYGTWESPLILIGDNLSGQVSNINKLDNITWNVSSEAGTNITQVEFYFNLSSEVQPVDLINLTYRGMINDTSLISAKLQLYNFLASTWDEILDLNQNNTWIQTTDKFYNDYVDSSSENLVKARIDILNDKPILTMIDYIGCEFITLTGNNQKSEYNVSLVSPLSITLNCTGQDPIFTYINIAYPNQTKSIYTVDYLENFHLNLFYNASENYQNGIPDISTEIYATIQDQLTGKTVIICSKDNNKIVYNGTQGYYILNFSTNSLNAGDYDIIINGSYPGYTPTTLSFILRVVPLETSLQTKQNGIEITKVSVYWNTSAEINISYLYSQQKMTNWNLSWQISQYTAIKGSTLVLSDEYKLSISTENLDTTTYTLVLNVNKSNYDSIQTIITIDILEIPTKLNGTTFQYPTIQVYSMERKLVYFNLTNNLTKAGVEGAITSYSIDALGESGELNDTGNGIYVLDIDTENRPVGTHIIVVHIKRNKFLEVPCVVFIEIIKRPTTFVLSTPQNIESEQGNIIIFEFNLTDSLNDMDLNFTIDIDWDYNTDILEYIGNSIYRLSINTEGIPRGSYSIKISCTTDNWTVETTYVSISITWIKILGLELPYFIAIVIAVVVAVSLFSLYLSVKRAKIPETVRKINSTVKSIKSKKRELDLPTTKSKSTLYTERYKSAWAILQLSPPIIHNKYLIDYLANLIQKTKSITMSLPEIEKLVNKLRLLGISEIKMTLENMGFPPELIDLTIRAFKSAS